MERVNREGGSILIVSLWMLTILTLLALTFSHKVAVELRLTAYQWDEARLFQEAETVMSVCRTSLKAGQAASFGALNQSWSQDPASFKDHSVPGGSFTLTHRGGDETLYGMEDEAGRININTAPPDVLERLFAAAPSMADAVKAWRTPVPGDTGKAQNDGPGPRNGPFQSVEELLLIKGMTPALFHDVKDLVTVDGDGRVNLNTASPTVLADLGLERSLAVKIEQFRQGDDGKEGTEDDGVFPTAAAAPNLLGEAFELSAEESASLANALAKNFLTARPGPLRLNVLARLADTGSARAFTIVVPPGIPAGVILHWHEGAP